ncbi:MAG: hypothetical protein M1823_002105 [Watsoniomyces obsoletus]|nr:MAG: hypothetical protein M1823_002105 [Watsoniomyces obsoletus]
MLKSTYQAPRPPGGTPPLPPGWTVHTAPTGHPYYYNASTKQSTYTHPGAAPPPFAVPLIPQTSPQFPLYGANHGGPPVGPPIFNAGGIGTSFPPAGFGRGHFQGPRRGNFPQGGRRNPQPQDKPKSKHVLAGYEPWLLVRTKFGRQFVYNPEKKESFWKVPDQLKVAIEEFERREKEKPVVEPQPSPVSEPKGKDAAVEDENEEIEEVEVTDDEDEEDDEENPSKRVRFGDPGGTETREFNEDDIAYQLAAMEQDYGSDQAEYDQNEEYAEEEGMEEAPLTEEDLKGIFKEMLNEHNINPYSTWEKIIEEGKIIEDERYTLLPNMKSRKEVWMEWSRDKIQVLKEQRAKAEAKDPLPAYLAFLEQNASVKLYWPEFRRKFKSAPEMRDVKVSDKQREKMYRDYINRMCLKPLPSYFVSPP